MQSEIMKTNSYKCEPRALHINLFLPMRDRFYSLKHKLCYVCFSVVFSNIVLYVKMNARFQRIISAVSKRPISQNKLPLILRVFVAPFLGWTTKEVASFVLRFFILGIIILLLGRIAFALAALLRPFAVIPKEILRFFGVVAAVVLARLPMPMLLLFRFFLYIMTGERERFVTVKFSGSSKSWDDDLVDDWGDGGGVESSTAVLGFLPFSSASLSSSFVFKISDIKCDVREEGGLE